MSEPLHNSRHDDPSGPAAGVRTARAQFEAARRRKQELIATGRLTAAPRETYSPLSGKTLAGFTLIREIHRGGQGVVYQALQQSTNRNVAIKVLLDGAHASPSARHRFDREIELVAGLRHPNVISVFHSDQTADGLRYCVMDYVRGRPLTTHVRETGLTLHDTLRLFARVCDAVNHAHQKGVIHRDLKPSNILVDDNGDPKILDFGLAKIVGGQPETLVSVTGQFVGTLPYMSPEQTRGNPDEVDTRTDVYALGVLLYEVLTGRYPYPVIGHVTDVLRHIAETDPTPPSRHGWQGLDADDSAGSSLRTWWPGSSIRRQSGGIDDDIQTIVLKALAKNRERRYQSAGELSRDIGHYLAGEPIESKRDSFAYVLGKQLRRQRAAVAVGMAFLLLIVAGLATSLTFAFKAKHALLEKESQQERAESFGDFLKEVLTLADPTKAKGEKLTMREALDRAAKRIDDGALREQPLVEADVRFTIGSTYWALSLWREAEAQFRAADVIQSRELGDEHTDTLRTRFNLARAKIRTDLTGAAKLAQATLETQQRVLGPDHLDTLRSRVLTGVAHGWAGRFAESESLLRSAIEGRRRTVGQDHVDTAYFLNRMGEMYTTFSYPEKAEPLHREALRIHSQALGDEHPDTITSQHDLAQSLYNQFRPEEAEVIYRKALEPSIRIMGPENPGTLAFQIDLAAALSRQGRHAEAEPIYRETLAAQRRTLGLPDFDTLTTQRLMAGALAQQRKYPEAEALLREALDVAREKFGPEDGGTTISLMCTLASVLADQEKDVEAEQIARQVLEFQDRQRPRPWPGEVQQSSLALIRVLRRRGAFDEAQRIERQLNELWLKAASAPDATTYTLYMAAWRLLKPFDESLRDSTEALKLAQRINEGAGQKYPRHLRTLALAYLQTGDVVRATKTWKQAVAVSPDDETRATTLNVAASELLEVTPEALCDPHQALEFARQANELTDHKNANYLDTLALAYFRTGDAPKAIEFQVQALKFLPKDSLQRPDFEAQLAEFKLVKENPGNDD